MIRGLGKSEGWDDSTLNWNDPTIGMNRRTEILSDEPKNGLIGCWDIPRVRRLSGSHVVEEFKVGDRVRNIIFN